MISIILPLFNSENFIFESVDSLLNQNYSDFELLIIDDGSVDRSLEIVSSFQDSRIKVFQREHSGLISGLNFGLQKAQGDLIARFDNDDVCLPDRLRKQVRFLSENPEASLVGGNAILIDEEGNELQGHTKMPSDTLGIEKNLKNLVNPIIHPSVMFRREHVLKIGGYRNLFQAAEDYDLWLRMSQAGMKLFNIEEPVMKLRKHRRNMSVLQMRSSVKSCLLALADHLIGNSSGDSFENIPEGRRKLLEKIKRTLEQSSEFNSLVLRNLLAFGVNTRNPRLVLQTLGDILRKGRFDAFYGARLSAVEKVQQIVSGLV